MLIPRVGSGDSDMDSELGRKSALFVFCFRAGPISGRAAGGCLHREPHWGAWGPSEVKIGFVWELRSGLAKRARVHTVSNGSPVRSYERWYKNKPF